MQYLSNIFQKQVIKHTAQSYDFQSIKHISQLKFHQFTNTFIKHIHFKMFSL
jgi:hypothetical protein